MFRVHGKGKEGPISRPQTVLQQQRAAAYNVVSTFDFAKFKSLLLRWIVCTNVSFSEVEHEQFRELLIYCNAVLGDLLPRSHNTIRDWVMKEFQAQRARVQGILAAYSGQVHLSFDMWTSTNSLALLGIVGHWIDGGAVQMALFGMQRLRGAHTGENMAEAVVSVIEEYSLQSKFGYFMLDNAPTNDVCVRHLCEKLQVDSTVKEHSARRLRCTGHVINLVVKAFLFGTDADSFEVDVTSAHELSNEQRELALWRKKGPVGKLHNMVHHIRRTPQRRERFFRFQLHGDSEIEQLMVVADNATRWNSTYSMIERAMRLKDPIDLFGARSLDDDMVEDQLSQDDWDQLTRILALLKPFKDLTMRMESRAKDGKRGSIWEILPSMEILLHHLETAKTEYEHLGYDHVNTCINNAWVILDKYYNLTDTSPIYVAAVVLNPQLKWSFLKQRWEHRQDWLVTARRNVKHLWTSDYKDHILATDFGVKDVSTAVPDMDILEQFLSVQPDAASLQFEDEYEDYCYMKPEPHITNIIQWWIDHSTMYPALSKMALDILSIPAMSAEVERVFSSAKLLITDNRNRLKEDIIEACECLKSLDSTGMYQNIS